MSKAVATTMTTTTTFPYKIEIAYLHQAITCAGLTGGEKTINAQRIKGCEMILLPQGLLIKGINKMNGKQKTTLVPMANIANLVLEDT
jgi:hypothetical protein